MPLPLLDPREVLAIHDAAIGYASRVHNASSQKAEKESRNLVAVSALSVLAHEMVCMHRAVRALATAGWAFGAPILLRAMIDAMCSIAVIGNSGHRDVAAFMYFYAFTKGFLGDPSQAPEIMAEFEPSIRAEAETSIKQHMAQMTAEDQQAASVFLKEPSAGYYWYSGLFPGPTAIVRRFFSEDTLHLYRFLSSATHAAFIGLRIFRDDPGLQDVNPRKDPRATGFAIIGSSRLLIEATRALELYQELGDFGYEMVEQMIRNCKPLA